MVASFVGFCVSMVMSHGKIMVRTRVLGYVHTLPDSLVSEQAVRGALAAGREKEGELATTSLEFEVISNSPVTLRRLSCQIPPISATRKRARM